ARGMVAPYAARRREFSGEGEIVSGITAIPLPGHTPGHTGYAIHSGNESLLIWGDIIHLPQMQFAHPEWGVVFDTDPRQARETRMRLFDRASADGLTVAGMHVDFPGIGYVERSAAGFRHIPAPWLPA
ncbi:MBL fold metallo-hydrolase, partial [Profundibacter sp.]